MKSLIKGMLVVIAALSLTASTVSAQTDSTSTNKPAATAKPKAQYKKFTGTIASVDADTKVITITMKSGASQKVKVGSKTKIKKDGEPGTFADAVVGQKVTGNARKEDSGDYLATSMTIGEVKPAAKPADAAK